MQNIQPNSVVKLEEATLSPILLHASSAGDALHATSSRKIIAILLGIALPLLLFIGLRAFIADDNTRLLEQRVILFLHAGATHFLNVLAQSISTFVTLFSVTILALFVWRRVWRTAFFWLCSVGGAAMLAAILKHVFHRDRPHLWTQIAAHASYSFPSGHAMQSMAIAVALIVIFRSSRQFVLVAISSACFALLVGLCRLYLGVHYPSDIAASWLLAPAWVIGIALLFNEQKWKKW